MSPTRISIIIPSFNQAAYLAETLQSVFTQNYAHIEIIVIDGGSKDGSVDILRTHAARLAYWISEPDQGQADAINKGLRRMTGDVWMFLNSDDLLLPGAVRKAVAAFARPGVTWVGGSADMFDEKGPRGEIVPGPCDSALDYLRSWSRRTRYVFPFSGACYMRREIVEVIGEFDPTLHYSMDIEYCLRAHFRGGFRQTLLPDKLAAWRWHAAAKTMRRGLAYGFREDEVRLAEHYRSFLSPAQQRQLDRELGFEKKQLVTRKACFHLSEGNSPAARHLLLQGLREFPGLVLFRPWWGAWRRVLLAR